MRPQRPAGAESQVSEGDMKQLKRMARTALRAADSPTSTDDDRTDLLRALATMVLNAGADLDAEGRRVPRGQLPDRHG